MSPDTESGQQSPAFKRRRVALACKACRNRKTRCDGARPMCRSCIELGLHCAYEQPVEPDRHIQRPSVNNRPQTDPSYDRRLASIESTLRLLVESAQSRQGPAASSALPLPDYNDDQTVDDSYDGEEPSNVDDTTDGMASMASGVSGETQASRYFGPSSSIAFLQTITEATCAILRSAKTTQEYGLVALLNNPTNNNNDTADLFVPPPSPPKPRLYTPGSPVQLRATAIDPYALPSASATTRMLDTFFSDTALLFPYVHESSARAYAARAIDTRWVARYASEPMLGLLNAIFAMAAHVDDIITSTSEQLSASEALESGVEFNVAEVYCHRAKILLAKTHRPSVERVQCLLLLAQYRQGTRNSSEETCTLHAQAVRLATQMGLHVQPSRSSNVTSLEQEVRNRTWLNCIMLDRILSMTFGCPPIVPTASTIDAPSPLAQSLESMAPGIEATAPTPNNNDGSLSVPGQCGATSASMFGATSKLYSLLGEIISQMYGSNSDTKEAKKPLPQILEASLSLDRRLLSWKDGLPAELCEQPWLDDLHGRDASETMSAKLSVVLHLRYLNVRIICDRATLDWFLRSATDNATSPSASELYCVEMGKVTLGRIQTMSKTVIDIIWRLSTRRHMLGAWWFSAYYILSSSLVCFACLLVRKFILPKIQSDVVYTAFISSLQDLVDTIRKGEAAASTIFKKSDRARRLQGTLSRLVERACSIVSLMPSQNLANNESISDVLPDDTQDNFPLLYNSAAAMSMATSNHDASLDNSNAVGRDSCPRDYNRSETMTSFTDSVIFEGLDSVDIMAFDDFGTF